MISADETVGQGLPQTSPINRSSLSQDSAFSLTDSKQLISESIKDVAKSMGINNVSEAAAQELASDATFSIRMVLEESKKFMIHAKRKKLSCEDIDFGMRSKGLEPIYGSVAEEYIPLRNSCGGGRDLSFSEDKEVDLQEFISSSLLKIPQGVSLRSHWLAIDGVMPAIPENPPALTKDQLKQEAANPLVKLKHSDAKDNKVGTLQLLQKSAKLKNADTLNVKQLAKHELSVEQQLYFKEITEACVGSDEPRRAEALQSLACDTGLHQMLPRLCTFIAEGVRINVVQHNLAILIYLMRMVKSLLENQSLFLEKYLHELIPAVTTCIVARQLCTRPEIDNHWALRDFASRLMSNICKNFNTSTNNVQTRITRMFCEGLKNENSPLVSIYGALAGLQELGQEVVKIFVIPNIKIISNRLDLVPDTTNSVDKNSPEKLAVNNIRALLFKTCCPVLKNLRPPPDVLEEYKSEFGSIGVYLHHGIQRSRQSGTVKSQQHQQQGGVVTA